MKQNKIKITIKKTGAGYRITRLNGAAEVSVSGAKGAEGTLVVGDYPTHDQVKIMAEIPAYDVTVEL